MIALCGTHAAFADGNHPTDDYLRFLKKKPRPALVNIGWPWKTEQVVFLVGGAVLFSERNVLSLGGGQRFSSHRRRIGERDFIRFDMQLLDPEGDVFLSMHDNAFVAHTARLADLSFSAQAKDFAVAHSSGMTFALRSDHLAPIQLLERVPPGVAESVEAHLARVGSAALDTDGMISAVTVSGRLYGSSGDLEITESYARLHLRGWSDSDPIYMHRGLYPKNTALQYELDSRVYLRFG